MGMTMISQPWNGKKDYQGSWKKNIRTESRSLDLSLYIKQQ